MAVLIDTNILLRTAEPLHPHFSVAKRALAVLRDKEGLYVAAQNLIEFWAVATRPRKQNGFEMSAEMASHEIEILKTRFQVLPEKARILSAWERLVFAYRVSGKNAHDARLVAAMEINGIDKILTFNTADFIRFREIQVLDPRSFS